jgi:hypothetical protein
MVQPIDYLGMLPRPDIGQSLLQGLQAGAAIRETIDARTEREQARLLKEQFNADLQGYLSDPQPQVAAQMILKYPQMREAFKTSTEIGDKARLDADFGAGLQAYHALQQGDSASALRVLDEQISALQNSGQNTANLERIRSGIERDPKFTAANAGLVLASIDPERFQKSIDAFSASQKAPVEQQKLAAETFKAQQEAANTPERLYLENQQNRAAVRNIDSQIEDRANRIGLDRDRLQSDTEAKLYELGQKQGQLTDDARKIVNDSVVSSTAYEQSASRALDLAGRLEKEGGGYGVASTAGEWLKRATGQQDAMSALRKEYSRLRNAQAIKDLPPGVATDKDVALALEGFPETSADARTISLFLRGVAKMNQVASVSDNAKAEWVNSVGHLGKARGDIVIDGVNVPAGTTFTDFSRSYIDKKAQQRGAEQAQAQVPNRSYMRFANPGAQ